MNEPTKILATVPIILALVAVGLIEDFPIIAHKIKWRVYGIWQDMRRRRR